MPTVPRSVCVPSHVPDVRTQGSSATVTHSTLLVLRCKRSRIRPAPEGFPVEDGPSTLADPTSTKDTRVPLGCVRRRAGGRSWEWRCPGRTEGGWYPDGPHPTPKRLGQVSTCPQLGRPTKMCHSLGQVSVYPQLGCPVRISHSLVPVTGTKRGWGNHGSKPHPRSQCGTPGGTSGDATTDRSDPGPRDSSHGRWERPYDPTLFCVSCTARDLSDTRGTHNFPGEPTPSGETSGKRHNP